MVSAGKLSGGNNLTTSERGPLVSTSNRVGTPLQTAFRNRAAWASNATHHPRRAAEPFGKVGDDR